MTNRFMRLAGPPPWPPRVRAAVSECEAPMSEQRHSPSVKAWDSCRHRVPPFYRGGEPGADGSRGRLGVAVDGSRAR